MTRRDLELPYGEETLKQTGMNLAARKNYLVLEIARDVARLIARKGLAISIEDVRLQMESLGINYRPGNWMGSVFKGYEWEPVGWTRSEHKGGHARMVRTWKLKGGQI